MNAVLAVWIKAKGLRLAQKWMRLGTAWGEGVVRNILWCREDQEVCWETIH